MQKLLVANRSEIAIRVFRAATELGLRTVAVYSYEDRFSLHRFKADESFQVGPASGGEPVRSYLNIENIIALAKAHQVDAIHPGYGFLSENAAFARACEGAGIAFVGPSAKHLEMFGDKTAAKRLAIEAGVPTIPGSEDAMTDLGAIKKLCRDIGYPVMLKASFGGGGRGMRVVMAEGELAGKLEECQREAGAAFGRPEVFVERYIPRARHIEVQILGDRHGNLVHLWERDCSVQRRHQKVVEVAPAMNLPVALRQRICEAAVKLCKPVSYYCAGTVEFLLDVDRGDFFFIEVNPRVQVEHTVTEMVTGVDIVQAQIQITQGLKLHEAPLNVPAQEKIETRGCAIQCRITTEDPANHFIPDYGRISTYRSAAGFGVRLDGGSAFGGAVITPYFDSLLVKLTTWAGSLDEAVRRMDRALREFRVRGVKTNIPFLENLIQHPTFTSGNATTTFIDNTPELFHFVQKKDRATKLLSYLGDVIVNGRPDVKKRMDAKRVFAAARIPEVANRHSERTREESSRELSGQILREYTQNDGFRTSRRPGASASEDTGSTGTKQLLDKLGPDKFALWVRKQKRLMLTDTTMRDAHQSLLATRVRTYDLLQVAEATSRMMPGLFSLEMWGGATFDTSMRFLQEDPWQRLALLRKKVPNLLFQMLLRASNAVGYTNYPDNVVREFIKHSAQGGIDVFRIFDSLNWTANMKVAMETVRVDTKSLCEAAICYTGDILDPARTKYSLKYYVSMAKELVKMGTHILAIKDMAGLCKPFAARALVKALRDEIDVPIHFHTHDTAGVQAGAILMAAEAGVDIADVALSSMSGSTSQPSLNSIVAALRNTPRDTGLDQAAVDRLSEYWADVREFYYPFEEGLKAPTAEVYQHEMPGGQFTNLKAQAASLGLAERWQEVCEAYAAANQMFGDIVKVTPSSKVVGDMALFMVTNNLRVVSGELRVASGDATAPENSQLATRNSQLSFPKSVVEMMQGLLGEPAGGWPKGIQKIILDSAGAKPIKGRPGAKLPKADLAAIRKELAAKLNRPASEDELHSYVMYPGVFLDYEKHAAQYGDTSVLPTPVFFYGLQSGDEITVEIEEGKNLIVKFLTTSDVHEDGMRTVFFELNGQPREVNIADKRVEAKLHKQPKADAEDPNQIAAPMPGKVSTVAVKVGQAVKAGERLLSIEAMKMETAVYCPRDATVADLPVKAGMVVEARDLLVVLETEAAGMIFKK